MNYIRTLALALVWSVLEKYQLLMLPMELVIDGRECGYPGVGQIKVTIERVNPAVAKYVDKTDAHAYVSHEKPPTVTFDRDDILVGVDALRK